MADSLSFLRRKGTRSLVQGEIRVLEWQPAVNRSEIEGNLPERVVRFNNFYIEQIGGISNTFLSSLRLLPDISP
jgi:hypothetical protein